MNCEHAKAVINAIDVALAVYAVADGQWLLGNAAFQKLFKPGEPPATLDAFCRQIDSGAMFRGGMSSAISRGLAPVMVELEHGWFKLRLQKLPDVGMLVVLEDVTDHMQMFRAHQQNHQELLLSAQRMSAGEMTTMLAHELNQPLGAALNYLSVAATSLQRSGSGCARLGEAVALAHTQIEHATDVVQRMREFVRSREPSRQPQQVHELVKSALRLLELDAQNHGIRVEVELPLDLDPVLADRVMIEQVLINLCRNAMEAMLAVPERSRCLRVSAARTLEKDVAIRVRDTGPGIDSERAGGLFRPFSSGKKNGLGIGLSLCRSIIEYHQGKLYFEPAQGGGTEFVFTLSAA